MSEPDTDTQPNVLQWDEFARVFSRGHKQGEHIAIVGQTGSGKTVLGLSLAKIIGARPGKDRRPSRVVVLASKPRDDTIRAVLPERQWPIVKKWPPAYGQEHCIIWPRSSDPETAVARQRAVFRPILRTIYHEGGQTLLIDEASKFERPAPEGYGLAAMMDEYWSSARSLKLTLIAGTQRPRHVTRSMWSEPSWVFVFTPDDMDDLKRVAELSGAREQVMDIGEALGGHEFLCIHRPRGNAKTLYVSKVE